MHDTERFDYQDVFDTLDLGLILLDKSQRVIAWNAWLASASEIESDTAVGRTLRQLFPANNLDRITGAISAAQRHGTSYVLTNSLHSTLLPLKTRTGRTLLHDIKVGAVAPRAFSFCLVQIFDVTVATEREHLLRERQNSRYDALLNGAADVILTLDADDKICGVNPAAERHFELKGQDLVGKPASVFFQDQESWNKIRRAAAAGGEFGETPEIVAHRKDGSPSYFEASISRWNAGDRVFATVILRDVNERRAAEKALRAAADELQNLNATLEKRVAERTDQLLQAEVALRQSQKMEALGQLTGGIAHDFNNLLQGIIAPLDRVKRRVSEGKIDDIDRLLTFALESANRAAVLIHRLLAFSRRQPIEPKPINLNILIASLEELLRRAVGESVVTTVSPTGDPWLVRCDSSQLENVLLNLAINARDAMPSGGAFTLETSNVTLDADEAACRELEPGEFVRLRVSDNGFGMPPEVKKRAFEPFFTTKAIGQGTGLGLSMVYGFVKQFAGAVNLESDVGLGTTVEIFLPRFLGDSWEQVEQLSSPSKDRVGGSEIILVVEDEPLIRLLIVEILSGLGYRVIEAEDANTALEILQSSQKVDLLVTDVGLPGLNGRQLADGARVVRPDLKVLFLTGYAEKASGQSFLERGMQIMTKPFKDEALIAKIREMIDSNFGN